MAITDLDNFIEFYLQFPQLHFSIDERGENTYILLRNTVRSVNTVFCFREGVLIGLDTERERGDWIH